MKIGIINSSRHPNPEYKTPGSSGMDIRANIDTGVILDPGQRMAVPTGIFLEIPKGLEAQVRPRSGLALKAGITVLNTPGTIDADYRGEILIILINHSKNKFMIEDGDRIAQLVITRVVKSYWTEVAELRKTKRDKGGFGSTGKK